MYILTSLMFNSQEHGEKIVINNLQTQPSCCIRRSLTTAPYFVVLRADISFEQNSTKIKEDAQSWDTLAVSTPLTRIYLLYGAVLILTGAWHGQGRHQYPPSRLSSLHKQL